MNKKLIKSVNQNHVISFEKSVRKLFNSNTINNEDTSLSYLLDWSEEQNCMKCTLCQCYIEQDEELLTDDALIFVCKKNNIFENRR